MCTQAEKFLLWLVKRASLAQNHLEDNISALLPDSLMSRVIEVFDISAYQNCFLSIFQLKKCEKKLHSIALSLIYWSITCHAQSLGQYLILAVAVFSKVLFCTHYNNWPVAASHSAAEREKMRFFEVPSFECEHRSLLVCLVSNLEPALKSYKGIRLIMAQ